MRLHHVLALAILALGLPLGLHASPAHARGENAEARAARAQGTVALNLGHYQEAVEHLARAYTLTQDPALLFSLAQAYRLGGETDKAIAAYGAFLRAAGGRPKYRALIERAAADIESIATFVLHRPTVPDTGEKAAPSPPTAAAAASPPSDVGEPVTPDIELPAGVAAPPRAAAKEKKPPALLPKPEPQPAPALHFSSKQQEEEKARPSHPLYKRWWFWTGLAAAAAGGATAWWYTRPSSQPPPATYGAIKVLP